MGAAAVIALVTTLVQGLPELEAAVDAIKAMVAGTVLTPAQLQALGAAVVAAHARVQGTTAGA